MTVNFKSKEDDSFKSFDEDFDESPDIKEMHNVVRVPSEDESEIIPFRRSNIEDTKFQIPNEGNINKSPMALFAKATNVFSIPQFPETRDKSKSFQSYHKYYLNKRSTTPQQKNFLNSNLSGSNRVHFESVKPKEAYRKSEKANGFNMSNMLPQFYQDLKRSQTLKSRVRQSYQRSSENIVLDIPNPRIVTAFKAPGNHPIESEQEDFLQNEIDEKVSSNKKYFKGNNKTKVEFKLKILDKDNKSSYKEHISK